MPEGEEKLDAEGAIELLNRALALQFRSVLQYTLSSGSLFGFEFQAFGDRFWEFARAELDDARRLVEKITALGGDPSIEVAELRWTGDPGKGGRLADRERERRDREPAGGDRADRPGGPIRGA